MRIVRPLLIVAVVVVIVLAFRRPADESVRAPDRRPPLSTFQLASLGGPEWTLAEQRGSVVLLNFWATWCPPCRRETPDLVTLAQTYGTRGLHIVGISMDDDPKSVVPAFIGQYHVPYPILVPDAGFALARSVESLPTSILLDKQGRVAAVFQGARSAEELAPAIEQLLAERN